MPQPPSLAVRKPARPWLQHSAIALILATAPASATGPAPSAPALTHAGAEASASVSETLAQPAPGAVLSRRSTPAESTRDEETPASATAPTAASADGTTAAVTTAGDPTTAVTTASSGMQRRDPQPDRWYLRLGASVADSRSSTLRDLDCGSTRPPALFGCGDGGDGKPLAAPGDFGSSWGAAIGLGARLAAAWRLELELEALPAFGWRGEANFPRVAGAQPVSADLHSEATWALAWWDLAPALGHPDARWQPFVGAGIGAARHRLDRVTYRFPGLGPSAVTVTRGGDATELAWQVGAGIGYRLGERATLELAYRYADLGTVSTEAGSALIVRTRGTFRLDVAPTGADLRIHRLGFGLRWQL
jgi:opacity protein-like surface antigen